MIATILGVCKKDLLNNTTCSYILERVSVTAVLIFLLLFLRTFSAIIKTVELRVSVSFRSISKHKIAKRKQHRNEDCSTALLYSGPVYMEGGRPG